MEPKEVFVFILCDVEPKEGRRGMCVCVSGKNRKMYLLEDIIEGPDLFRVEGVGLSQWGGLGLRWEPALPSCFCFYSEIKGQVIG